MINIAEGPNTGLRPFTANWCEITRIQTRTRTTPFPVDLIARTPSENIGKATRMENTTPTKAMTGVGPDIGQTWGRLITRLMASLARMVECAQSTMILRAAALRTMCFPILTVSPLPTGHTFHGMVPTFKCVLCVFFILWCLAYGVFCISKDSPGGFLEASVCVFLKHIFYNFLPSFFYLSIFSVIISSLLGK
jgi:hypothetical protein